MQSHDIVRFPVALLRALLEAQSRLLDCIPTHHVPNALGHIGDIKKRQREFLAALEDNWPSVPKSGPPARSPSARCLTSIALRQYTLAQIRQGGINLLGQIETQLTKYLPPHVIVKIHRTQDAIETMSGGDFLKLAEDDDFVICSLKEGE